MMTNGKLMKNGVLREKQLTRKAVSILPAYVFSRRENN